MNKERKAERAPAIKKILKKYGLKGSLSVRNYSTLALKIKDIRGLFVKLFDELTSAMYGKDYYDRSDAMTDYFDTSHYISIDIHPSK